MCYVCYLSKPLKACLNGPCHQANAIASRRFLMPSIDRQAVTAVSSKADLSNKRGTFIYDMVACRELILVSEADGSDVTALMPDATAPVPQDPATIDALSRKLSRMLGKGTSHAACCMFVCIAWHMLTQMPLLLHLLVRPCWLDKRFSTCEQLHVWFCCTAHTDTDASLP